jgi:hypothetical protein
MEDIDQTPADEPEAPDSPVGSEDESATPGEVADTEESPEAETTEDEESEAPAKGSSSAYEKLLAKYGGDTEKLAESVFEQYNSASRLNEQVGELKAVVESLRASKETTESIEEAVGEDPYVKEINAELGSIQSDAKVLRDRQATIAVDYQKGRVEVARLEGELARADESDRYEIREALREKKQELKDLERENSDLLRRYDGLQRDWKSQQRAMKEAQARARARVEGEKQDAILQQERAHLARREYNEVLREEAKSYGIDVSSKSFQFINESFRAQIRAHLQDLRERGVKQGIDMAGAVKYLMKEYAEAAGLKPVNGKKPAPKSSPSPALRDVKVPTPDSKRESSTNKGQQDASYWRDRARRLMP